MWLNSFQNKADILTYKSMHAFTHAFSWQHIAASRSPVFIFYFLLHILFHFYLFFLQFFIYCKKKIYFKSLKCWWQNPFKSILQLFVRPFIYAFVRLSARHFACLSIHLSATSVFCLRHHCRLPSLTSLFFSEYFVFFFVFILFSFLVFFFSLHFVFIWYKCRSDIFITHSVGYLRKSL